MRRLDRAIAAALCAQALWACGCARCPETRVSIDQLLEEYNANASAVRRLWARVRMEVTMADENGRTFTWGSATPNGLLILAKSPGRAGPPDFALIGLEMGQQLFRVGSSSADGVYYCWYRFGSKGVAMWGRQKYAGAAGVSPLAIDPYQLLAVLGVCELPADLTTLPTVAMTMSRRPCAYVLTYIGREPTSRRVVFRRETFFRWSDRRPRRPFLINFFSPDGRRVMTATMKKYRPIELADLDKPVAGPVVMPTDITIEACGREGPLRRIHMVLSEMTTARKWDPAELDFHRNVPPGIKKVQIDKHVTPGSDQR